MALDLTTAAQSCHDSGEMIGLDELITRLDARPWTLDRPDEAAQVAGWLAALGRNRHFLADLALEELKQQCSGQARLNRYSAQVLVLHRHPGRYFIRANFWPAGDDQTLQASGADHYFYHQPHDHNFDFLTVGYCGPGYRSQWFEHDGASLHGYVGESTALTPVEQGQLTQGRILHYRAHRDVHDQLPPDALSVSINIIPESADIAWRNQYFVDIARQSVIAVPTMASAEIMLRIAATLAPAAGLALAQEFAERHPSPRMRWTAWRALIGNAVDPDQRRRLIDTAQASDCRNVAVGAAALAAGQ